VGLSNTVVGLSVCDWVGFEVLHASPSWRCVTRGAEQHRQAVLCVVGFGF
jgi:hypothetical protein